MGASRERATERPLKDGPLITQCPVKALFLSPPRGARGASKDARAISIFTADRDEPLSHVVNIRARPSLGSVSEDQTPEE